MKFYIITKGSYHYSLYECKGIKTRNHIHDLDIHNYDDLVAVKREFKKLINVLHPTIKYSLEYKG